MISPRWRKVLRELWMNRARTILVVASIGVGIFAVGTVQHLRTVILSEMQAVYDASAASQVTIFVNGANEDALEAIRRMPEIADAINTISALMAQQIHQIGVMKAIGARRYQIVWMYLGTVLIYSLAALAIAIPLTMFVAGGLTSFLGGFINVDFPRWSLPTNVFLIQLSVGIIVPLLAALFPVFKGASITVREAVSDYGTGGNDRSEGWFTRLLASIRGMSRPMQLSMRNTFRRKGRLILTLITLVLGGMLFMTVGSVRASLDELINKGLDYYQFDVQFQMARQYRSAQIATVVSSLPEVASSETWDSTRAIPIRTDGSEGDPLDMTALPAESAMVMPTLIQGRWLLPDDQNAIVLSQNVISAEPDVKVGKTLTLEVNGKKSPWVVVGIAHWSIQRIVIVEGVFIGWISWILGAMLAWPVGALLANTVGLVLFQTPLPYTFSATGVFTWFAIVTILGALASFLPAWNASRLTVREVLAYQ